MRICPPRRLLGLSTMALAAGAAPAVLAAPKPMTATEVHLQAGPLEASLLALAKQTGVSIVFTTQMVEGRQAPAVNGRMTPPQAVALLIAGGDLELRQAGERVLVLRPRGGVFQTATVLDAAGSAAADPGHAQAESPVVTAQEPTVVAEIVVGSHIRGLKDTASPVVVLSREAIDQGGYASIAEALTALPQAFGGTASEDSVSTGADPNGTNFMRGTGVDLRGLGADATLVLVNGRRMAGAGVFGDFSDLSAIPFVAVGKVNVLLDGASALYGADAVGGVVDIRLRHDLDGGETRLMAASATQGGYSRYLGSQALGRTWSGGHVLLAYEHTRNEALRGADRPFTGQADLRALGGSDRRSVVAGAPGNILRLNAAGAYVATYAIPAGQDGTALKPGDFTAGTVNRTNQKAAYDVIPRSTRHSAVIAAEQALGLVTLSGDLRLSHRKINAHNAAPTTTIILTPANPYFVSPTGQASERIAYAFQNEAPGVRNWGEAESLGLSLGGKTRLGAGWNAELHGGYAQELGISRSAGQVNSTNLSEAAGLAADSPLTGFSAARDGYFNPYIGQGSNKAAVLDFILSGWDLSKVRSESRSVNLGFDGPLLRLPGGLMRLAVGGQLRREALRTGGARFLSGYAPFNKAPARYSREVRSAYAELNAPLVSPDNALPGIERLELSLAGRIEDYDDVGSTTNPKVGLVWVLRPGLTLKASYGTSFRAPALSELNIPYAITPIAVSAQGGQVPSLVYQGGNPNLRPETARSWTAGVTFTPNAVPDLTLSLSAYRTAFKDRVGSPVVLSQALTSAQFAPFRTFLSPATNPADRAKVLAAMADPNASGLAAYPVDTYGAIIDLRYVNTGSLDVAGLDASAAWKTTVKGDPLALNASLSWLTRYERKLTPTSAKTPLAGQAGYPADLRARITASWTHGPALVTTSVNHVGDLATESGRRIAPWTTVDLQGSWRGEVLAARNLTLTLNVQNLFDQDPPFYDNPLAIGYDPANADPLGRMISLQLTKTW